MAFLYENTEKKEELPKDSSIKLDNITFAYENSSNNAIDGVSLSVKSGEASHYRY